MKNKKLLALKRLRTVWSLLRSMGLEPQTADLQKRGAPKKALACWSFHEGVLVSIRFLKESSFTANRIDHLTFCLLHELGHAVQQQMNLYPEVCELARGSFNTKEEWDAVASKIKFPEATHMHLEHDADAVAIDMALRLGMSNPMKYCGYL